MSINSLKSNARNNAGINSDNAYWGNWGETSAQSTLNSGSNLFAQNLNSANSITALGGSNRMKKKSLQKYNSMKNNHSKKRMNSRKKKGGAVMCYTGAPKCGDSTNMANGPPFYPTWNYKGGSKKKSRKQKGGYNHNLPGSTWGLDDNTWARDLGRNPGVSDQMASNELNQTSQMTQRRGPSLGGITIGSNSPGNSGVQLQMKSTQAGGKKSRKQKGGKSSTLDYSKWESGPDQNPGAFWAFPGNAGVYSQLEASTPYGDSAEKLRGPRLGSVNVLTGEPQGNPGVQLQMLAGQSGAGKKKRSNKKTASKKNKKTTSKKNKKSKSKGKGKK